MKKIILCTALVFLTACSSSRPGRTPDGKILVQLSEAGRGPVSQSSRGSLTFANEQYSEATKVLADKVKGDQFAVVHLRYSGDRHVYDPSAEAQAELERARADYQAAQAAGDTGLMRLLAPALSLAEAAVQTQQDTPGDRAGLDAFILFSGEAASTHAKEAVLGAVDARKAVDNKLKVDDTVSDVLDSETPRTPLVDP